MQDTAITDPLAAALIGMVLPTAAAPAAPQSAVVAAVQPAANGTPVRSVQPLLAAPLDVTEKPMAATSAVAARQEPAVVAGSTPDEVPMLPMQSPDEAAGAVEQIETQAAMQAPPPDRAPDLRRLERPVIDAPVRLGSRLAEDVGQRVVWMAANGQHAAELRVDPPQLGPVEVRLTLTGDQASLTLLSPHAAVRDALQLSLPRLQEMLVGAGIELGSVNVGTQSPGQDPRGEPRGHQDALPGWMEAPVGATSGVATVAVPRGLVDTYA